MKRLQKSHALALIVYTAASTGCATIGTMQTANTVGAGNVQFALEPAYEGAAASGQSFAVPRLDLSLRFGVSESVDLGVRVGTSCLEFTSKFQFTDPNEKSFVISLAPSVGGLVISSDEASGGIVNVSVPLLLGIGVGEGSQLVLGPKALAMVVFGSGSGNSGATSITLAGATVGFSARLGERFRLLPEVGVVYPILAAASLNGDSQAAAFGNGAIYQVSLGFLWGGK